MSNSSQRHKLEIHGVSNDNIDLGTAPKQVRADVTWMLAAGTVLNLDLKSYFEPHGPYGYTYALSVPIAGLALDANTGTLSGTASIGTDVSTLTVTHTASSDTSTIVITWTIL